MSEIIKNTWETYLQFKGVGMHLGLYFAAVLFLNILSKSKKEKENSSLLSGHSLLFWGIFFFPVTAKVIIDYCIGDSVYWRMFWILPFPIVIAYAFALSLKQVHITWKRYGLVLCMAAAIMVTGTLVYTPENFSGAENRYRIPQVVVDVCQIVNEDARENNLEERKVVAVNDLLPYIRQYDGSIRMPYGRNGPKEGKFQNKNCKRIYNAINSPEVDFKKLLEYAKKEHCNYLVYFSTEEADAALGRLGCQAVGDTGQYRVFALR